MKRRIGLIIFLVLFSASSTARGGQVRLAWDAPNQPPALTGYRIYCHAEGQEYDYGSPAWEGPETTCAIIGLLSGVTYYFVARAYNDAGMGKSSNEVSFQGNPPAKLLIINIRKENGKMYLIADPQPVSEVDYYEVEMDGAIIKSDPETDQNDVRLHHDLTGISMGSHTARVRAINSWGEGPWSDPFDFAAQSPGKVSGIGLSAD